MAVDRNSIEVGGSRWADKAYLPPQSDIDRLMRIFGVSPVPDAEQRRDQEDAAHSRRVSKFHLKLAAERRPCDGCAWHEQCASHELACKPFGRWLRSGVIDAGSRRPTRAIFLRLYADDEAAPGEAMPPRSWLPSPEREAEVAEWVAMRASGLSLRDIGRRVGRDASTVRVAIARYAKGEPERIAAAVERPFFPALVAALFGGAPPHALLAS